MTITLLHKIKLAGFFTLLFLLSAEIKAQVLEVETVTGDISAIVNAAGSPAVTTYSARDAVTMPTGFRYVPVAGKSLIIKQDYTLQPTVQDPQDSLLIMYIATGDPHTPYVVVPQQSPNWRTGVDEYKPSGWLTSGQTLDKSLPVGKTPGSLTISPTGAAAYNVPIQLPAGSNGLAPNLSVAYNSQVGNGLMGKGWNLSGLSSISRVSQTLYHDNNITAVNLTASDRFSMDGGRLLVTNGGTYGADNTQYDTESRSFSTVISHGTAGTGPQWFEVKAKDGSTIEYGNTPDSRVLPVNNNGTVLLWRVNKVTDIYGNAIKFFYNSANGESWIDHISYGGPNADVNVVYFVYGKRKDNGTIWVGGVNGSSNMTIDQTLLLRRIDIQSEGKMAKQYWFDYAYEVQSLLCRITESGSDGKKLNPTVINWKWTTSYMSSAGATDAATNAGLSIANSSLNLSGDFNGDGHTDIFAYVAGNANAQCLFADNTGKKYTGKSFAVGNFILRSGYADAITKTYVIDTDGDGSDEVGFAVTTTGVSATYFHVIVKFVYDPSTSSFTPAVIKNFSGSRDFKRNFNYLTGDFDSDQKDDILLFKNYTATGINNGYALTGITSDGTPSLAAMPSFTGSAMPRVIDFNGNGKTDILNVNNNVYAVYEYDKATNMFLLINSVSGVLYDSDHIYPGDFNGDGKTDLFRTTAQGNQWYIYYSNGVNFVVNNTPLSFDFGDDYPSSSNTNVDMNSRDNRIIVSDYDGDGKSDVLFMLDTMSYSPDYPNAFRYVYLHFFFNQGMGKPLRYQDYGYNTFYQDSNILLGDFDKNGTVDVMLSSSQNISFPPVQILQSLSGGTRNVVNNIYDGIGKRTQLTYATLEEGTNDQTDFFIPSSGMAYPLVKLKAPVLAVQSVAEPDGLGGTHTVSYMYRGGVIHLKGKGFLGFQKFITTDVINKIRKEDNFSYDASVYFPYPSASNTYVNNVLVSTLTNTYTVNTASYTNHLYFAYPSQSVSAQADLGTGVTYATVTTGYSYDPAYGDLTGTTKTYGDGSSEAHTYTYNPYGAYVRRLVTDNATNNYGGTTYLENKTFTYDAVGKLASMTVNPDAVPTYAVKTEYLARDNFGNPTDVKVSAPNYVSTPALAVREILYGYDVNGRFRTQGTNPMGQVSNIVFDNMAEQPVSFQDIDGLYTTTQYDGFKRVTQKRLITGIIQNYSSGWASSSDAPHAAYYTLYQAAGDPGVKVYFDVLGREVHTEKDGFNTTVKYEKTYDARGRLAQQTQPAYGSVDNVNVTTYTYDDLNRPLTVNHLGVSTGYVYNGLQTKTTSPDGKTDTRTNSMSGQLKQVVNNAGQTISYQYHGCGKVEKISLFNKDITITYQYGSQKQYNDPSTGIVTYTYDPYGQLIEQVDADNNDWTMTYDKLGRLVTKTSTPYGKVTYNYVASGKGAGLTQSMVAPNGSKTFTYDELSRLQSVNEQVTDPTGAVRNFTTGYAYDMYGNLSDQVYPSGFKTTNRYNGLGYLTQIDRTDGGTATLWTLTDVNALEKPVHYFHGNNVGTTYSYDARNYLSEIRAKNGAADVYWYGVTFDGLSGNVTGRADKTRGLTEIFTYDNLDRLTSTSYTSALNPTPTTYNIGYAANGNITGKDDAGIASYTYSATLPYAVTQVNYSTHISGSLTGSQVNPQNITYNALNLVSQITQNSNTANFTYGPDDERNAMQVKNLPSFNQVTYYIDNYEVVKNLLDGTEKQTHYVYSPYGLVGVYIIGGSQDGMYYAHSDHLGSVNKLTNASGGVVEQYSFDAWGRRRNYETWGYAGVAPSQYLTRGFTMHEHLDQFDLINMNGRLYDPITGRFLSPDPNIQQTDNPQNYNAYSYCLNNPFRYFDPSGDSFWDVLEDIVFIAVAVVVTIVAPEAMIPILLAVTGAVQGGFDAAKNGGSFGDVLLGAFTGFVVGGVTGGIGGGLAEAASPYLSRLLGKMFPKEIRLGAGDVGDNVFATNGSGSSVFYTTESGDLYIRDQLTGAFRPLEDMVATGIRYLDEVAASMKAAVAALGSYVQPFGNPGYQQSKGKDALPNNFPGLKSKIHGENEDMTEVAATVLSRMKHPGKNWSSVQFVRDGLRAMKDGLDGGTGIGNFVDKTIEYFKPPKPKPLYSSWIDSVKTIQLKREGEYIDSVFKARNIK